jgi:hypothetical protein
MMAAMALDTNTERPDIVEMLAYGRIGLGLALMTAPSLAAASYLGRRSAHPTVKFVNRLFGGRDVALGVWALSTRDDKAARRTAVAVGAACDAWDAIAMLSAKEGMPKLGRAIAIATAASAAGAGLMALRDLPA